MNVAPQTPPGPRGESLEWRLGGDLGLRATFDWRGDRYAHVVALLAPAGSRSLLESIEGDPDDRWPPSPAFQQLSMQGEGDRRVALLVGMAGKSHWSMSVEVDAPRRGLVFDVACRLNEPPRGLGSSYLAPGHALDGPRSATGQAEGNRHALILDPTLPENSQALSISAGQLRVDCLALPTALPFTARWKYLVTLV